MLSVSEKVMIENFKKDINFLKEEIEKLKKTEKVEPLYYFNKEQIENIKYELELKEKDK